MTPATARHTALFALLLLTGCRRDFFQISGSAASTGPMFGKWNRPPQGCSRDPIDGLPVGQSASVASFFWEDPAVHDKRLRDGNQFRAPDVPQQLDILHEGPAYAIRVKSVKGAGWLIHAPDCSTLEIHTEDQPPAYQDGRPTLKGSVALQCAAPEGTQVTADFHFSRCEY